MNRAVPLDLILQTTSCRRLNRWILSFMCLTGSLLPQMSQAADAVVATQIGTRIDITIDGQPFTTLHLAPEQKKPYFWPILAADGAVLTRPIVPGEKEHPHHKGLWISIDEVNHSRHWMEREAIINREATILQKAGDEVRIQLENEWLNAEGVAQLQETTLWTIGKDRLIKADIHLKPIAPSVTFADTKEGFFGLRIAQSMRELQGGKILTSNGAKTTKEGWGKPAAWIDYTGPVDGKLYGVTIFDDAANFRPSRYHVRDYGLFTVSPFGEGSYQNDATKAAPVTLEPAGPHPDLKLRYGLWIHEGAKTAPEIQAQFESFGQQGK